MNQLGRSLMVMGFVLVAVGVLFTFGGRIGLGRLPGDIVVKRKNFSLYAPVATSIIISLVLTLLANLFFRRR